MSEIRHRLQEGAAILEQLERRRIETRTPALGYDTEFLIVYRELRELEAEIVADPGALESRLAPIRRKRLSGNA
jgi:hypothetical protein